MRLIYKCSHCGQVIEQLEVAQVTEQMLGLDILTAAERADIIEIEGNNTYIHLSCEQCRYNSDWNQFINI